MKKILLAFVLLSIFACSNDEGKSEDVNTSKITGQWHLIDILDNGKPVSGYSCNKEFDITEFTSSGQSITKYSDKNSNNICTQYTENGNYTIAENILTDTQKNGNITIYEVKYKILELTNTALKLETISIFEANSNGSNPIKDTYKENEEVKVYKK